MSATRMSALPRPPHKRDSIARCDEAIGRRRPSPDVTTRQTKSMILDIVPPPLMVASVHSGRNLFARGHTRGAARRGNDNHRVEQAVRSGYNATMHWLQRWLRQALSLTCMVFVVVSLAPGSPSFAQDEARVHSIRVRAQLQQVLYETSSPVDLSVAAFSVRPWQYSPVSPGRLHLAPPSLTTTGTQTTFHLEASPDYPPRILWPHDRRYGCQILDIPPPALLLPSDL